MRKLARVGRPCSRSASSARTSAGASGVPWTAPRRSPRRTTSSRMRCSSARCQASRGVVVAERVGGRGDRRRPGVDRLRRRRARRARRARRSTSSAKRPARSIAPLSTSSSGSTPPNSRCSSSVIVTPTSSRSRPARQVPAASASSLNGARCAASRPQRMPARRDPVLDPREVVVVEPEAPAHRLAVGEVEHLRGGHPLRRRGRAARRPRRAPGWSGAATRSASRTRRSGGRARAAARRLVVAPRRVPAPNVAWMSGAKLSMSGHITMTSRGSSVGSSASRCRIASRSTSTWRARPWQAWTCDAAVAAGASGRIAAAGGGRSARTSAWQAARAASRPRVLDGWWWSACVARRGATHELQLARVAAPGREQRVGRQRRRGVVGAADDRRSVAPRAAATARARGAGGRGGRRGRPPARAARRGSRRAGA